ACAINGRTALVSNRILHRSDQGWAVQATIAYAGSGDVSGDTAVIGLPGSLDPFTQTPGQVRLYHRDNGVWSEQANLPPPASGGFGFGIAAGIDDCTIVAANHDAATYQVDHTWVFEPTNCVQ